MRNVLLSLTIKRYLPWMDLGLNGKIALVAASSKGLGLAVATAFAREGARLVMCARNRDALEAAADRICESTGADVYTVPVDLTLPEGPRRFVEVAQEEAGGVDILVTNTGGPPVGTFAELDETQWRGAFDGVLMSANRLIHASIPGMKKRGGGRIINITSISVKEPIAGLMLSNALRAAVVGMAKTLATELGPEGILINNVCPGRIATDRLLQLDQSRADRSGLPLEQVRRESQQRIPLGRYGQPDELAALVVFLASSQASYMTGTTILCDGGAFSGLM
jgi:3-oxoacyl-[acyl-carrier protein] reductase